MDLMGILNGEEPIFYEFLTEVSAERLRNPRI